MPTPSKKPPSKKAPSKKAPSKKTAAAADVLPKLRAILARHAPALVVKADGPGDYYLEAKERYLGKELLFGGVRVGKGYVSYYLFPLYMWPELAQGVSPALLARRQGKSCFNFKAADPALFAELAALTKRGFAAFREAGLV